MVELSDEESKELMAKIARGDRGALAKLIDGHTSAVEAFIGITLDTTDRDTIRAVSQEVWLVLMFKADRYEPSPAAKFTTWLIGVVKRCCKAHRSAPAKQAKRDRKAFASSDLRREEVAEPDHLEERDMMDAIKTKLLGMAVEKREALALRFFLGLTVEEVAAAQAAPLDTVKSRITSALNKLRAIFARES
jgi:RNA polymerase sigma-70 factor (ECF subfamily)